MGEPVSPLLLDTHAAIWLVEQKLRPELVKQVAGMAANGMALVSPISAWEVGLLSVNPKLAAHLIFKEGPLAWFEQLVTGPLRLAPFTPAMAIGASLLPDWTHKDPADRLLVSTARTLGALLITRDAEILRYGAAGHVRTLEC